MKSCFKVISAFLAIFMMIANIRPLQCLSCSAESFTGSKSVVFKSDWTELPLRAS